MYINQALAAPNGCFGSDRKGFSINKGKSIYYYKDDPTCKKYSLNVNHDDVKSGKAIHLFTGKAVYENNNGDRKMLSTVDHRVLSGEYKSIHLGKLVVKDNNGNRFKVDADDQRYIQGKLVGVTKGYIVSDETKLKLSKSLKGIIHSIERNKKISKTLTGRFYSDERVLKVKTSMAKRKALGVINLGRVSRLSDRKEMDAGNFKQYLNKLSSPLPINDVD